MLINNKIPKYLLGKYQLIGTVTFSVLFAIVYLNLSIPFSDTAWFELGNSAMFLMTLAYIGIAIITLVISRMLMYLGVAPEIAAEDACRIEHAISDESFAAIKRHLEQMRPEVC